MSSAINSPSSWQLIFEDEFETLNHTTWAVADNFTHTWPYSGRDELQLYTKDEVFIQNGSLALRTRHRPDVVRKYGNSGKNFTSGWIDSSVGGTAYHALNEVLGITGAAGHRAMDAGRLANRGFSALHGRFEWRAKLPSGATFPTIWPALWMMPEPTTTVPRNLCWPAAGEIDVLEMWGGLRGSQATATLHYSAGPNACGASHDLSNGHVGVLPNTTRGDPPIDFSKAFHTFAVEWTAEQFKFSVDDKVIGATKAPPAFRSPFYLIMNVAICGGKWCDTGSMPMQSDAVMLVDYVRVYKGVA